MTSSRWKELSQTRLWVVFNTCLECFVQRPAQFSRPREDKKALHLGFIFRPQTKNIQYFEEGMVRSFVSAFVEKFALFCTETLPGKHLKIDIKSISFQEPTSLLVSTKARSSGIINNLVPRALVSFAFKIRYCSSFKGKFRLS